MAYLRGFGRYLPERVVANSELATRPGLRHRLDRKRLRDRGTALRRAPGDRGRDGGARRRGLPGAQPDARFSGGACHFGKRFGRAPASPGPGCEIAHALGIPGVPAIDLPMASAGSVFGLALAEQTGAPPTATCCWWRPEKMSAAVDTEPLNRNTAILFGDGAGAALISSERGMGRHRPHRPALGRVLCRRTAPGAQRGRSI